MNPCMKRDNLFHFLCITGPCNAISWYCEDDFCVLGFFLETCVAVSYSMVVSSHASAGSNTREGINWGGLWASEENCALKVCRNHSGFNTWRRRFVLCSTVVNYSAFWTLLPWLGAHCYATKGGKASVKAKVCSVIRLWTRSEPKMLRRQSRQMLFYL